MNKQRLMYIGIWVVLAALFCQSSFITNASMLGALTEDRVDQEIINQFEDTESELENTSPSNFSTEPFHLEGVKAAILYDASSGVVLYEYNADEPRPPASMTKMMTYFVVMDAISEGKISWDDKVTASEYAAWTLGSQIGIEKGEKATVRELVYALLIPSANDAAVMLAEHVAGSEPAFAEMMNEKAHQLGLSPGAHFVTASGLGRNSLGPYNPMWVIGETMFSARDAAQLADHLIKTYPEILTITSTPEIYANGRRFGNTNLMLESRWPQGSEGNPYIYPGVDGLKTGYIAASGYTLTATAVRNGLRLISVVMGAETNADRFLKSKELLDYGFAQYLPLILIKSGKQLEQIPTISIMHGDKEEVAIVAAQDVVFLEHPEYPAVDYEVILDPRVTLPFEAPIQKGERVGVATIFYRGSVQQVDLIAAEDVHTLDYTDTSFSP